MKRNDNYWQNFYDSVCHNNKQGERGTAAG